jgi:hypothetical protein
MQRFEFCQPVRLRRPTGGGPSNPRGTAAFRGGFQSLPGSSFTEFGAAPATNSFLYSAVAEISFKNGISLAGKFDGESAQHSQTYIGTGRLRYTW